ncbi:MAG: aromatic ring-hydroxylating dioxygenase subunit alpha [Pseudomonadota bacterium]
MTLPSVQFVQSTRKLSEAMADRNTAFVFDEWYVAGYTDEFARDLFKRTLLGRNLVFFRTEAGKLVALDDRCAHRSYPLSLGTLDGDTLICGYHGLRYDERGDLIEIPSQERCPKGVGVRAYALKEIGPLVWIWMGEPAAADESKIPALPWVTSPEWVHSKGYMHLEGNYVSFHENLLDLTHLSYIHAKSFGTPDYAHAPFDVVIKDNYFALERRVVPTKLPPIWAQSTGLGESRTAARIAQSEFLAPGVHETTVAFYDTALPESERPTFYVKGAHLPTPETQGSTHYFVLDGRSFALDQEWITKFMHEQLAVVFQEDVVALADLEKNLERADENTFEISIASDRPSVEMRKFLKQRAEGRKPNVPVTVRHINMPRPASREAAPAAESV